MPPVNTPTVQVPAFSAKQGAILDVLPPALPSARLGFSGKKPEANLSGAANDFQDLEQSRKLTFSEMVPAPKMAVQEVLELAGNEADDEADLR